jgi:hypothetical protein
MRRYNKKHIIAILSALLFISIILFCNRKEKESFLPVDLSQKDSFDENATFYGKWKVVEYIPDLLVIKGILPSYKHLYIAQDMVGKEVEYNPCFYRVDDMIFDNITYIIEVVSPDDYSEDDLSAVIDKINLLTNSYESSEKSLEYEYFLQNPLHIVFADRDYDEVGKSAKKDESEDIAGIAEDFLIKNEDYILQYLTGLLCQKIE